MYRDESKNFFYDITISTPDGKKSARLTDTLMKQCIKADIVEAIASEESGQGSSSLNLSFIEADFLPDSLNKTPAEGVAGRGYTTNRTGALLDIRFDSEKGFTYVTPQELQSGRTQSSRTQSGQSEPVSFMFSNNNIVDITWGHLEPRTSRSRRFKIGTVNYATGASGNTLTLSCYTLQKDMQRLKLSEGKVMVDQQGTPMSLKQCVYAIANVFGARVIFDEEVLRDTEMRTYTPPDNYVLNRTEVGGDSTISSNGNPSFIIRSESIDYWLKQLAIDSNSEYEIYQDPFDPLLRDTPIIRFTAKKLRYKKVVRTLNYRGPNGTMLSFEYNTIAGEVGREAKVSAIDENGKSEAETLTVEMSDGRNQETRAKTFDAVPYVYRDRAAEILDRDLVSSSTTSASTSESSITSKAEVATYQRSFMGFITVKTVGHPDYQPDVMNIQGVGVRASTTYRFFQVQHSLSSAGYTCTMQGKTQEVVDQGIDNKKQLENNTEVLVKRLATGR